MWVCKWVIGNFFVKKEELKGRNKGLIDGRKFLRKLYELGLSGWNFYNVFEVYLYKKVDFLVFFEVFYWIEL